MSAAAKGSAFTGDALAKQLISLATRAIATSHSDMLIEGDPANWVDEGRAAARAVVLGLAESAESDRDDAYVSSVVAADLACLADVIADIEAEVGSWIPEILGASDASGGDP